MYSISLMGVTHTIEEMSEEEIKKADKTLVDSEFLFGATIYTSSRVLINKDLSDPIKKRTLRHELTHALLFLSGHCSDEFNEEEVCDIMAAFSYTIEVIVASYGEYCKKETISNEKDVDRNEKA